MKSIINKKILSIFFFISWLSLFGAINVYPSNIFDIKTFLDLIHTARITLPLLAGLVLLILLIKELDLKIDIKKINIYLLIFFLLFTLEFIGLALNDRLSFGTLYLLIFGFITIFLIALIEKLKLQKIYKFMMFGAILYILVAVIFLFLLKVNSFKIDNFTGNFYNIFHPDSELLGQAPLRATGYSRLLAVVSLFVIVYFSLVKNKSVKIFLIIFNTILAIMIWQFQSRGTYICYYLSIFLIIFVIEKRNPIKNKIQKLLIYFFFPILISIVMTSFNTESQKTKIISQDIKESFSQNLKNNRLISNKTTTGRIKLWTDTINYYEKKKFFGYGIQGDRYLITKINNEFYGANNPFGTNVSNGAIYSFLSGGYLAILFFLILYGVVFYLGINLLRKIISINKIEPIIKYSSTIMFYFTLRSIFENSFALYSIDFLLFLLAVSIIHNYLKQNRVK